MQRRFLIHHRLLAMLRFWSSMRVDASVPDWDGDTDAVPAELLPHLIIAEEARGDEGAVYRHVGSETVRWGRTDPTGRRVAEFLAGDYRRYIRSLVRDSFQFGEPIFSAALYEIAPQAMMTGRLFTPFTLRGSPAPAAIMSLHLYAGETMPLARLGTAGFVEEIERFLVPGTPAAIAELEKAQRLVQYAQASDDRTMVAEWDAAAEAALSATLRPLPTFQSAADRRDEGEQLTEPQ